MPLGFERINERKRRPNELINFIKPLEGPDKEYAQDFLERVAAICVPIMKANHLVVMSLEEYPPNREFVGRNFNAGEVIQLVLKGYGSNRWLSFREVQLVMMHELAHCKQMNHSGAFWKVRNQYCDELRGLWQRQYTGDGFWSRGQTLLSGKYTSDPAPLTEILPHSLCGGTYRTRSRKRKQASTKPKESYAEAKQRRIAKKFGVNGSALGGDEETRVKLENGKTTKSKPRVANSKRGRELRANALLQRLENQKKEQVEAKVEELSDTDSETASDLDIKEEEQAVDLDGSRLFDQKGNALVRVCGDEDEDDQHWKDELRELKDAEAGNELQSESGQKPKLQASRPLQNSNAESSKVPDRSPSPIRPNISGQDFSPSSSTPSNKAAPKQSAPAPAKDVSKAKHTIPEVVSLDETPPKKKVTSNLGVCIVCSMQNDPHDLRCTACGNVLDPSRGLGHWQCKSLACKGSNYINANDCGICGVCGAKKA